MSFIGYTFKQGNIALFSFFEYFSNLSLIFCLYGKICANMEIRKVGIYGTGKVALSFGRLLHSKGFEVGYFGRNVRSVQGYIQGFGAQPFDTLDELIDWCDAVGFVVTDSAISEISRGIEAGDKYAFHMSGALAADELAGSFLARFSLHPLRAFAKVESDISDTVFALEIHAGTISPYVGEIDKFAECLGKVVRMKSSDKPIYHASAVMASNLIVPVISAANSLLGSIGISDEDLLWQLIDTAISNMKNLGVRDALTGPIARGDSSAVKLHLEEMSKAALESEKAIYIALSRGALELSKATDAQKAGIAAVLQNYERGENE